MSHMGQGTRLRPLPVTGNGHRRVTLPKGDQFSGRNLGMVHKVSKSSFSSALKNLKKVCMEISMFYECERFEYNFRFFGILTGVSL